MIDPVKPEPGASPILRVENLSVAYEVLGRPLTAVSDVSFMLDAGGAIGIVGESGSGKSTLARAIFGALPENGRVSGGRVWLDGRELDTAPAAAHPERWKTVSFVPQAAMASLDPLYKIGRQVGEIYRHHLGLDARAARAQMTAMLAAFDLPERTLDMYPHELSGGMQQRVIIAAALALEPKVLIADEPTTALDTLVQDRVFATFDANRRRFGSALVLVTHDIGLVADFCQHVLIMRNGRVEEQGPTASVLSRPAKAYTRMLLAATPRIHADRKVRQLRPLEPSTAPILEFRGVSRTFAQRGQGMFQRAGTVRALDDVSFTVRKGEVLGIIGASGSGKTTIANIALGLDRPTAGDVVRDQTASAGKGHRHEQLIFQNPYLALNPIYSVAWAVSEPLRLARFPFRGWSSSSPGLRARVLAALTAAELKPAEEFLHRRLHQLSGGQRQRVAIARAMVVDPELIIADEPVSMLDVSIRAEVLQTLRNLVDAGRCGMIYITHDLATVGSICDRLVVLRAGRIVEAGDCRTVLSAPRSEYTRELLQATPGRRLPELAAPAFSSAQF
jgi:peptide/nickel transport system ATP-binding protein